MSDTPRTVSWCSTHDSEKRGFADACWDGIESHDWGECRMVEFELHPVGTQEKLDTVYALADRAEVLLKELTK